MHGFAKYMPLNLKMMLTDLLVFDSSDSHCEISMMPEIAGIQAILPKNECKVF